MAKFIELTIARTKEKILYNTNHIRAVYKVSAYGSSPVTFIDCLLLSESQFVQESYETVKELINEEHASTKST